MIWFFVSGVSAVAGLADRSARGLIVLGALFAMVPFVTRAIVVRRAKRLHSETAMNQEKVTFSFSDDGISFETARGQGALRWTDLHKWRAGPEHALLYVNSAQYYVLPRNLFASADDWDEVERRLRMAVRRAA